jgi:signal transduction histidine kinase
MKIRTRLTLLFTIVVASILGLFSLGVYYFSAKYREREFYGRLRDKARTTARLLIEVDEVNANLLKVIDRNNLTSLPQEQVMVYNALNQIVYDSDENPHTTPADKPFLNQIRNQQLIHFRNGQKEVVGVLFRYQEDQYVIIASALDRYGLSKLRNLEIVLLIGWLGSLVVVGLAGWIYSGRAISPMSEIVQQADKITASNMNLRIAGGEGKDEISQLAHTFNRMLDRLQQAFEIQRSFVANASHELRTPLTIITGQIEVTLIKRRTVEEYEKRLKAILADISNLNTLSNNLLELAQVSMGTARQPLQEVQVDELIYQAALTLNSKHPDYHVSFAFEDLPADDEQGFIVMGDATLLSTAFLNLMENACKFSPDKSVKVVLGAEGASLKVQFTDRGIGIAETETAYIFEPFYRAGNAKEIKGHGIGLSLTQKIIGLHKGTITVASGLQQGTTFMVLLPRNL